MAIIISELGSGEILVKVKRYNAKARLETGLVSFTRTVRIDYKVGRDIRNSLSWTRWRFEGNMALVFNIFSKRLQS